MNRSERAHYTRTNWIVCTRSTTDVVRDLLFDVSCWWRLFQLKEIIFYKSIL
jgi:hypothetical protein